jgi:hypothetical protein
MTYFNRPLAEQPRNLVSLEPVDAYHWLIDQLGHQSIYWQHMVTELNLQCCRTQNGDFSPIGGKHAL